MNSWHTYPKIYHLGHTTLQNLFVGRIIIEEKIDGSQFSFGIINNQLRCKSKNANLDVDQPENLFQEAIETVKTIQHLLTNNWTYRAEYLKKPKHNTLQYERVPYKHLIIFDINDGEESYLSPEKKLFEAKRIGLECVPILFQGLAIQYVKDQFSNSLQELSYLGGTTIEGIVIKNYSQFGNDKKVLMGKYVSEKFKEQNKINWKHTTNKDILNQIIEQFRNENCWKKSIQHLQDQNKLEDSPKDIKKLIKEIQNDIQFEWDFEIKNILYNHFKKSILAGCVKGFPEFYKKYLIEKNLSKE